MSLYLIESVLNGQSRRAVQEALDAVCHYLAVCVARDGEGATRLLTVEVSGARTEEDARRIYRLLQRVAEEEEARVR